MREATPKLDPVTTAVAFGAAIAMTLSILPRADAGGDCVSGWSAAIGTPGFAGGAVGQTSIRTFASDPSFADGILFAGGIFTSAGGGSANHIAAWDGVGWSSPDTGVSTSFGSLPLGVYASRIWKVPAEVPRLYVGGTFQAINPPFTSSANLIASWDGNSWSALGTGLGGGLQRIVRAIEPFDGGGGEFLYVGGNFSTAGGSPAVGIARWNGLVWSGVGGGINPASSSVNAMTIFDDGSGPKLYVGGTFSNAGGAAGTSFFARWTGSNWQPVPGTIFSGGSPTSVECFCVFDPPGPVGPSLYVGGSFASANGNAQAQNIVRYDGLGWSPIGGGVNQRVRAIAPGANKWGEPGLIVAGDFTAADGDGVSYMAWTDGVDRWEALPFGSNDSIYALHEWLSDSGSIVVGGEFDVAGALAADCCAEFSSVTVDLEYVWSGSASGVFKSPEYWSCSVPPSTLDPVAFIPPLPAFVTAGASDTEIASLRVVGTNLTIDPGHDDFTIGGARVEPSLLVGGTEPTQVTFRHTGSPPFDGVVSLRDVVVAPLPNATATLLLDEATLVAMIDGHCTIGASGAGALIANGAIVDFIDGQSDLVVGEFGSGQFEVTGGAVVTVVAANAVFGQVADSEGELRILGQSSVAIDAGGSFLLGAEGQGAALIEGGSSLSSLGVAFPVVLGGLPSASAEMTITGSAQGTFSSFEAASPVHIGPGGPALVTLANGCTWDAPQTVNFPLGTIEGRGTFTTSLANQGVLRPAGAGSTGTISVIGDFSQVPTNVEGVALAPGRMELELTSKGHDRLYVFGSAELGGTVAFTGLQNFDPGVGEVYDIITAYGGGSISGQFDLVTFPGFSDRALVLDYGLTAQGSSGVSVVVISLAELLNFDPVDPFDFSGLPTSAVTGQFDDDPRLDIAVTLTAGGAPGSVLILMNASLDGFSLAFESTAQVAAGVQPRDIVTGNFDADETLDLAVVNSSDHTAQVLANDGSGLFSTLTVIPTGLQPMALASFDLVPLEGIAASRRRRDLAICNMGSTTVTIHANDGTGVFTQQQSLASPDYPCSVDPVDFDGDGAIDLAVGGVIGATVQLLENDGAGTFSDTGSFPVGAGPVDVVSGNLDPTGAPPIDGGVAGVAELEELITADSMAGTVSILRNLGGGQFAPVVSIDVGPGARSIALVDFDLDGDLDIAVIAEDSVKIYRNDSVQQLAFAEDQSFTEEGTPVVLVTGLLTPDDDEDLILISSTIGGLSGNGGGGGIAGAELSGVATAFINQAANPTGDIDQDGDVDGADLGLLLTAWGSLNLPLADLDGDGTIDGVDLGMLLSNWG